MKNSVIVFVSFFALCSFAQNTKDTYKQWKTFHSNYGYEFKYPSCWIVGGDSPDEPAIADASSRDILIEETDECPRSKMVATLL
jgi:hypothetical protein